MRSFLAVGLSITLCASASADPARHSRHVIVYPGTSTPFRTGPTLDLGRSPMKAHRATTIHPIWPLE